MNQVEGGVKIRYDAPLPQNDIPKSTVPNRSVSSTGSNSVEQASGGSQSPNVNGVGSVDIEYGATSQKPTGSKPEGKE
jgi:hypothetical protein